MLIIFIRISLFNFQRSIPVVASDKESSTFCLLLHQNDETKDIQHNNIFLITELVNYVSHKCEISFVVKLKNKIKKWLNHLNI